MTEPRFTVVVSQWAYNDYAYRVVDRDSGQVGAFFMGPHWWRRRQARKLAAKLNKGVQGL